MPNLSCRLTFFNLEIVLSKCWLKCRSSERTDSASHMPTEKELSTRGSLFCCMMPILKKARTFHMEVWSIRFRQAGKWPLQSWIPILQKWHFQACWISSITRWDCYLQWPGSWIDSCFMYLSQALYVSLPLWGHGFSLCYTCSGCLYYYKPHDWLDL